MNPPVTARISAVICIVILLFGIYGCSQTNYKEMYEQLLQEQPPEITAIQFESMDGEVLKKDGGWVRLEEKVKILITLNKPAFAVELYIVPTGTGTYKLQQLIDVVYAPNAVAEYTWDVPEGTMGHFWVVAHKKDMGRQSDLINVIRES